MARLLFLITVFCIYSVHGQNIFSEYGSRFTSFFGNLLSQPVRVENQTRNSQQIDLDLGNIINVDVLEDSTALTPALLTKYRYPSETYSVTTDDGYILGMHRIPRIGAQPVFLMHGLLDTSATWVLMGPEKGLGYILYDLGYDVWMGNARGNRYSRNHTSFRPESASFWDFSFHEIGIYDVPAMVDLILEKTNFQKTHYIAHSQGTAVFWVMCSEKPEYADKILSMHAFAPIAFVSGIKSPFIKAVVPFIDIFQFTFNFFGIHEFMPNSELLSRGGQAACHDLAFTQSVCSNVLFLIAGFNTAQLNTTMLPVILGHTPSGASVKQFMHFGQLVRTGKFQKYDYGYFSNKFKYGGSTPTEYKLENVKVPVALYYSSNDWLCEVQGVEKLAEQLPNVIDNYLIPLREFNHLDFLWAMDGRNLIYNQVIDNMRRVEVDNSVRLGYNLNFLNKTLF